MPFFSAVLTMVGKRVMTEPERGRIAAWFKVASILASPSSYLFVAYVADSIVEVVFHRMELGFTIIDDISHVPPQSFCIVKIPTLPVIFLALSVGQIISGPDLPVQEGVRRRPIPFVQDTFFPH